MRFGNYALLSLALSGLLLLDGCGGGGGGGGGLPTASNPAITPPPSGPVGINTGDPGTNNTTAAIVFEAVNGSSGPTDSALLLLPVPVAVQVTGSATEAARPRIANIVRRHAQKIRDHKLSGSATGVQTVETFPCFVSGTETSVFDDVSGNASEIFVNCNEGGVVLHGTLSSVIDPDSVFIDVGSFVVSATFTIDLSITDTTVTPNEVFVTQGSMSFTVTVSGNTVDIFIASATLTSSLGGVTERLSNFNLIVFDNGAGNVTLRTTTPFTFASTALDGSVTVDITTPILFVGTNSRPSSGVIEITGAPGKIRLTILGPDELDGVQIDVFTNATDPAPAVPPQLLTWSQFEALV